ncbi:MAG TPA: ATP-binding protein [Actinomycetota bacterium]|jgi:signal transduction histidine kinase
MRHAERSTSDPERRGLFVGILAYRWVTLAWMSTLALVVHEDFAHPAVAYTAIGVTIAWNVWFTIVGGWADATSRWIDLALATALLPLSGYVMEPGTAGGTAPFFATSYPAAAALTIGASGTPATGLAAGSVLSLGLILSRPVNGIDLLEMPAGGWANLVNGVVYYLTAGGAAGLVSRALSRSSAQRSAAIEEAARERERTARLAERDALGREIHDSVLQALSLLGKRSRELGERPDVTVDEVRALLEDAGRQEQQLRTLLSEPREPPPPGAVSLRVALEAAAFGVQGPPVTVAVDAGTWLDAGDVEFLAAAVRQALDNACTHARATRVTVFAERLDGEVVVSVRDDGIGFVLDEATLEREGKLGILKSMKGRIEELGGRMELRSAPGLGTDVEFHVPVERGGPDG